MRTFPMRLLLSAVIVAAFAVTSVGANAGSSTVSKVGPLKLCTYSTGDVIHIDGGYHLRRFP